MAEHSAVPEPTLQALGELVAVVTRLRDPDGGCPWDLEQTHASLIPYLLEEAHEVADAIRHGDDSHLQEELGDLLLQVVLHARIAAETDRFDLASVARSISAKLIRRHPHVFAGATAADSDAVRASWEAIKAEEREQRRQISSGVATSSGATAGSGATAAADPQALTGGHQSQGLRGAAGTPAPSASPLSDQLATKVRGQPALAGAMTISRKAAAAGFEWDDLDGVWSKVHEEFEELREAVASGNRVHAQEELGDLLFTLVNVARWTGVDPEEGLAGTNRRFLERFARVEAALGGDLGGRSLAELEKLWQQAKAEIRAATEAPPGEDH
ncbi:MAG: nucleoside triphosphate pyrophosphohydrolase [Synechococcaceae cyanobacterium]|nr:nucleoside triphosphate pyrophosphohydrolase [Synechococcaceae cyanobacterium]